MAELPDLGRHCALQLCGRLDYTPYSCRECKLFFCATHRFAHGCPSRDDRTLDEIPQRSSDAAPLRPYVCSLNGCHGAESIKVVCPGCGFNFCLKHRHDTDHDCPSISKPTAEVPEALKAQAAHELAEKHRKMEERKGDGPPKIATAPQKKLSPEDQKKADRIAVMKLKMKMKSSGVPPDEALFIFVETPVDQQRRPLIVSKKWSVGRCVDAALKSFEIPNQNSVCGNQKCFRFFTNDSALPEADCVLQHLKDMESTILRIEGKLIVACP